MIPIHSSMLILALLLRDPDAVVQFKKATICPSTGANSQHCPGYIVDHIVPLVCKGADSPTNMQYQTVAEAKFKDRWERACARPSDQE